MIKLFTESDGLQGKLFFQTSRFKSKDGTLWFGGMNGVNFFKPENIKKNIIPPRIYFTSLTQAGEPLKTGRATEKVDQIVLDWKQNFIEFEFAVLNYTKPEKNKYAYFLQGHDKDWYYTGSRPFGRYTNLSGGIYTLKIKGANNDGVWSQGGQEIKLIVKNPWWAAWWFKLLAVLLVSIMIIWRLNDLRRHRNYLENQVKIKTTQIKAAKESAESAMQTAQKANQTKSVFLANMSHELRTPLNSILGYSQILKKENRLAISHQLVTLMGGKLKVLSREKQGSKFEFTLIFSTHSEKQLLPEVQIGQIDGYTWKMDRPIKILIADDHVVSRNYVAEILESIGFRIFLANDGQQAVEKTLGSEPDVILMDLMMAGMDGFEATGIIRTFRQMQHAVIIAVSTTNHGKTTSDFNKDGFNDFIIKPIVIDRLLQKIKVFTGLKWKTEEWEDAAHMPGSDDQIQVPPEMEMKALYDLARRGNLRKVKEMGNKIRQQYPQCDEFTRCLYKVFR